MPHAYHSTRPSERHQVDRLRLTFNPGDQDSASELLTPEQRVSTGLLRGFRLSTPWKRLSEHQRGREININTKAPRSPTGRTDLHTPREGGMPRPPASPPPHYLIRKKSKCPSRLLSPPPASRVPPCTPHVEAARILPGHLQGCPRLQSSPRPTPKAASDRAAP